MRTQYSHLTDVELTRLVSSQDCSALEHELSERLIKATQHTGFYAKHESAADTLEKLRAMVPVEHNVGPEANNV